MANNTDSLYKNDLTLRELEVLIYLCFCLDNEEIAKKMCVAVSTVSTHLNNIYSKLGVSSTNRGGSVKPRMKAVIKALELGIVTLKGINDEEE